MTKRLILALTMLFLTSREITAQEFSVDPASFLEARFAADEGKFDRALLLLTQVIEKNPGNPVLLYERANVAYEAARFTQAEAELVALTKQFPTFYDAHKLLGRFYLEQSGGRGDKLEAGLVHLKAAFDLAPDDLATGMSVAQILGSLQRYAEAEKVVAALLENAPQNKIINYNYAQILTKLGRGNESQKYLETVLAGDPSYGPAILQLVDIYQKTREYGKAAEILTPIVQSDPLNIELQRQYGFFLLRAGRTEEARKQFEEITKVDPRDSRSLFMLADSLSELDRSEDAEPIYRQLLEKNPDDPELMLSYAMNQQSQRKFEEAAKSYGALLLNEKLPDNARIMARTQLAAIAHQSGRYDEALTSAKEVLIGPKGPNYQAINVALDVYRREKKYADAVQLLEELRAKFAADPVIGARFVEFLVRSGNTTRADEIAAAELKSGGRISASLAETYAQLEQYSRSIDILQSLLKKSPDDFDLKFQLASAFERAGKTAEAETIFLSLLSLKPTHTPTLNYLGYMWADRGVNLQRAADMLTQAVKIEPRNAAYLDSLGWVYFRLGKLDLAERYLRDAIKLLPTDPTVQEHLGDVHMKKGDRQNAIERYRAALKLEPSAKEETGIRAKLEELEKGTANR